ncbi:serine/threonine-protein kinase [Streptomyces sp. NPDC059785]|uniref:serine/threonine-protein kinase n=1 Tax=Streptomyces sp. NPDC059785 TaxID=3346945 RepID=UPI003665990D
MQVGPYTVERALGEGDMGVVYLARSRGGRPVAVKVAHAELARDPAFRERFRAEVQAARSVGGFHTASVVDADPDAEPPWLATAYIPGPTLAAQLAEQGPMHEARLRGLGAALAEALQAIHACGLVHRDLKPGNIIMAADGPRVLDFGIARAVEDSRLTMTGTGIGTPGFLAPEQAEGLDVTGAADVFALGAVLVAAAGGSAFGGGTPMALMYRSVHHDADVSAVPAALRPVVTACLAKSPAQRPTPEQLLEQLTAPAPVDPAATTAPATQPATIQSSAVPLLPPPPPPTTPPHYVPTAVASVPPVVPSPLPHLPTALSPAAGHEEEPEFLATDRKNAILADNRGISLGTDGTTVDLPWPSITQVTYDQTIRTFGYTFTVTVRMSGGGHYACQVKTRQAERLEAWIDELEILLERHLPHS